MALMIKMEAVVCRGNATEIAFDGLCHLVLTFMHGHFNALKSCIYPNSSST